MTNATDAPSFEAITTWERIGDGRFQGLIHQEWTQGRGAYGGVLGASAVRAMRATMPAERALRQVDVRFMAAVVADTPAVMTLSVEHESKRVSHLRALITQGDKTACVMGATFAESRASTVVVQPPPRPAAPAPETLRDMPFIRGLTPNCTRFLALRWTSSAGPFSGADTAECEGWCRFKTEATAGPEGIVGLLDAWPPPVLPVMKRPAPAASVTWSAQLVNLPETLPDGWFFYRSEAVDSPGDGYARMRAQMWLPDGRLCASTEQLVAVFG